MDILASFIAVFTYYNNVYCHFCLFIYFFSVSFYDGTLVKGGLFLKGLFLKAKRGYIYLLVSEELQVFNLLCLQGTEFMDNLAQCLRYYVADRLSNDPGWANITVRVTFLLPAVSCFILI